MQTAFIPSEAQPLPEAAPSPLSPRETEIARMVTRGLTNKEIAQVLDISPWTVSAHLRRVYTKLGICRRGAMSHALAELS